MFSLYLQYLTRLTDSELELLLLHPEETVFSENYTCLMFSLHGVFSTSSLASRVSFLCM